MTINLSEITFDGDFFSVELPLGGILVINSIDECLEFEGKDVALERLNIFVVTDEEVQVPCTSVIGMSDDYVAVTTEYKEYEGQVLNKKNMSYCKIEVAD